MKGFKDPVTSDTDFSSSISNYIGKCVRKYLRAISSVRLLNLETREHGQHTETSTVKGMVSALENNTPNLYYL